MRSLALAAALVSSGCNNKVEELPYNPETLNLCEQILTEASILCINGRYEDALLLLEENKFYDDVSTLPASYQNKVIPLAKYQQYTGFKFAVRRVVNDN